MVRMMSATLATIQAVRLSTVGEGAADPFIVVFLGRCDARPLPEGGCPRRAAGVWLSIGGEGGVTVRTLKLGPGLARSLSSLRHAYPRRAVLTASGRHRRYCAPAIASRALSRSACGEPTVRVAVDTCGGSSMRSAPILIGSIVCLFLSM